MPTVTIDGREVSVPSRVNSWESLRRELNVEPGRAVVLLSEDPDTGKQEWILLGLDERDVPGEVPRYWDFYDGEVYKTMARESVMPADEDDDDPADWWKS